MRIPCLYEKEGGLLSIYLKNMYGDDIMGFYQLRNGIRGFAVYGFHRIRGG